MKPILPAIVIAPMLLACASLHAENPPVEKKGDTLVNQSGMTLYTFDKDTDGKSACTGQCASNWPPLAAGANAKNTGDYTVITRDDGSKQWAYKGKPLYTYKADKKPGEKSGDNFRDVWHAAKE
ncbi:lipoprotein [Noviherbaspirillum massiliense]